MTPTLAQWGIGIRPDPVPEDTSRVIVKRNIEYQEAITLAIDLRKKTPEIPVTVHPVDHGLYTVVQEVVRGRD